MLQVRWAPGIALAVAVVAVIAGAAGWYWYLKTPAPPAPPASAPADATPGAPSAASPGAPSVVSPGSARATAAPPAAPDTAEPITLSARELREALGTHAPLNADEAYARIYQGREVTWGARVSTVSRSAPLVRLDMVDGDGLRVVAWCETAREVAAGQQVTVRGRVTTKLADGFVVERCELR
jgi:hypothetical protein